MMARFTGGVVVTALIVAGFLGVGTSVASAATYYQAQAVHTAFDVTYGLVVTPTGAVVTNTDEDGSAYYSFVWQNGSEVDSPTSDLGCWAVCDTEVTGLNGSDQISGYSDVSGEPQAFREDLTTKTFQTLSQDSEAYGINAAGQVVGTYRNAAGQERAFLWDGTTLRDLGTLGGQQAVATATSSTDQAVGCSQTSSGAWHPFLYQNGAMHDLGLPPGLTQACAYSVNQHGWIVGGDDIGPWDFAFSTFHATVGVTSCHAWIRASAGAYTTLSPPPGFNCIQVNHIALNNQVVGDFMNFGFSDDTIFGHPFTYQNGTFTPLTMANLPFDTSINIPNDPSDSGPVGELETAWGNNLHGQLAIAAQVDGNYESWALLLTPIHIYDDISPAFTYRGSWSHTPSTAAWGGTVHEAGAAGGSVSFTFTGKTVSVIGPDGPGLGRATIYIDGTKRGSVAEANATASDRNRLYQASFKAAGKHTLRLVASPGFELDAVTTSQH
jgi:probable HAF family extracellular repeat protein